MASNPSSQSIRSFAALTLVLLLVSAPGHCLVSDATAKGTPGRHCVDCHAFEFMERALTAMQSSTEGLITRTDLLLSRIDQREGCHCSAPRAMTPAISQL
uniref:NELL2-interacting cell ontogeny regulator 1 n=1 Tax=Myxine glutinosa TaxID=7769 RepID=UPI00358F75DC